MTFNFNVKGITPKDIAQGSGSGSTSGGASSTTLVAEIINGTVVNLNNSEVTQVKKNFFESAVNLEVVNLPNATTLENNAFLKCSELTNVNIPKVTTIGDYAFQYCSKLTNINMSSVQTIGTRAFNACTSLTSIDFTGVTSLGSASFNSCTGLKKAWLPSTIETVSASSASQAPLYKCGSQLVVYTDLVSEADIPSGWGANWNASDSSVKLNVVYGATYEDYKNA